MVVVVVKVVVVVVAVVVAVVEVMEEAAVTTATGLGTGARSSHLETVTGPPSRILAVAPGNGVTTETASAGVNLATGNRSMLIGCVIKKQ